MLKWMKDYNSKNKIQFTGFDPQSLAGPTSYLKNLLKDRSTYLWQEIDQIESFLQQQRDSIFEVTRTKRINKLTASLSDEQTK